MPTSSFLNDACVRIVNTRTPPRLAEDEGRESSIAKGEYIVKVLLLSLSIGTRGRVQALLRCTDSS